MDFDFEQANQMLESGDFMVTPDVVLPSIEEVQVNDLESASKALDLALRLRVALKNHEADKKSKLQPINAQRDKVNENFKSLLDGISSNISKIVEKLDVWSKTVDQFDGLKTESGSLYFKKKVEFAMSDSEKVPQEFLMLNQEAVLKAYRAGVEIPGITVHESKETHIRLAAQE